MKRPTRSGGIPGFLSFLLTGLGVAGLAVLLWPSLDSLRPVSSLGPPGEARHDDQISGTAYALDGDSLSIDERDIRLVGIDAPELFQECQRGGGAYPCGRVARDRLAQVVRGNTVRCRIVAIDRYGRALGECHVGDDFINQRMVAEGWAVAYRRFEAEEAEARRQRKGIWAGRFELPQHWRDTHKRR